MVIAVLAYGSADCVQVHCHAAPCPAVGSATCISNVSGCTSVSTFAKSSILLGIASVPTLEPDGRTIFPSASIEISVPPMFSVLPLM